MKKCFIFLEMEANSTNLLTMTFSSRTSLAVCHEEKNDYIFNLRSKSSISDGR